MPTINLGKIRLNWLGPYSVASAYAPLDAVSYNGDSFVCVTSVSAVAPKSGSVVAPQWDTVAVGATQLNTLGDTLYFSASGPTRLGVGAAGQVLQVSGASVPAWTSALGNGRRRISSFMDGNGNSASGNWSYSLQKFLISEDGRQLLGTGYEIYGVLGRPAQDSFDGPTGTNAFNSVGYQAALFAEPLDAGDKIKKVVRVPNHTSYFITDYGYVYAAGYNGYGQLGLGDTTNRRWFSRVPGFGPNDKVASDIQCTGAGQTVISVWVLTSVGEIWAWGYNGYYNLGDNTTTQRNIPTRTTGTNGIVFTSIHCGQDYFHGQFAISASGNTLYAWGDNQYGALGMGDTTSRFQPTATNQSNVAEVIHVGHGNTSNRYSSTWIRLANGTVRSCGYNNVGQLGVGDTTQRNSFTDVALPTGTASKIYATGRNYMTFYAVNNSASVYACGYNGYGQVGDGTTTQRNALVLCQLPSGFQGNVSEVYAWGTGSYHLAWVRTTSNRWCSFGWWGAGAIVRPFSSSATTVNHPAEFTNFMPDVTHGNTSGIKEIFLTTTDDSSRNLAGILYNDGRMYWIGNSQGTYDIQAAMTWTDSQRARFSFFESIYL